MRRVFTVNVDESFFDTLAQHMFSEYGKEKEISKVKVILPCKRDDVTALLTAFKNLSAKKCIILPEIVSLENLDEENLVSNLNIMKVIKRIKRTLLLIQFLLDWNKKHNDNFSIDLVHSLSSLSNKTQYIQTADDHRFDERSKKIGNFINSLAKIEGNLLEDLY